MRRFPKAQLIGIDGSALMLDHAEEQVERMGNSAIKRVELIQSPLPNFSLSDFEADLVVYCFPNICPAPDEQPYYDKHGSKKRKDVAVGRRLAKARESDPEEETEFTKPEELFTALTDAKVISRNLRGLVRMGGYCARVEYANSGREGLSDLVRMRLDFEAGALRRAFKGRHAETIFKLSHSQYFRSRVIEDVYHQTGDESDSVGGYLINILRAI